jgi:hypothetical protein
MTRQRSSPILMFRAEVIRLSILRKTVAYLATLIKGLAFASSQHRLLPWMMKSIMLAADRAITVQEVLRFVLAWKFLISNSSAAEAVSWVVVERAVFVMGRAGRLRGVAGCIARGWPCVWWFVDGERWEAEHDWVFMLGGGINEEGGPWT